MDRSDPLANITHVLLHEGQEEQTSLVQQDPGGCLLVVVLQDELGPGDLLGFRPMASSMGVQPLEVTVYFSPLLPCKF